jgi:hypothetical protein
MVEAEKLVLEASYREDIGNTRNSGSELIVRQLTEMKSEFGIRDHNQGKLADLSIKQDPKKTL